MTTAADELVFRVDGIRHTAEIPASASLDITHPAVRDAAKRLNAQRKERQKAYEEERRARRPVNRGRVAGRKVLPPQPQASRWKAISSGAYKRKMRPRTSPEDRLFVPAALEHWRKIHGLSQREAGVRIGYSPNSCSWAHWESGFVCPPYGTLLRVLAATGLGFWVDSENRAGVDPALRLDVDRAQWAANMRRRRRRRAERKPIV